MMYGCLCFVVNHNDAVRWSCTGERSISWWGGGVGVMQYSINDHRQWVWIFTARTVGISCVLSHFLLVNGWQRNSEISSRPRWLGLKPFVCIIAVSQDTTYSSSRVLKWIPFKLLPMENPTLLQGKSNQLQHNRAITNCKEWLFSPVD